MTNVARASVLLVTSILLAMTATAPTALGLGSTAYEPATYEIIGSYDVCQHQRVQLGGEERLELVLVGFVGTVDGEPTVETVLHLTSFEPIANPCNTATPEQGTVHFEEMELSGTGVFVL